MNYDVLLSIILLLIGFFLLIKGADFFVEGSSGLATKLKVPSLIIGLTVVAMGTSLPELSVSVAASLNDSNSLAISNALGSNMFNLLVVLGLASLFSNLEVDKAAIKRDFPVSIACLLLLIGFSFTGAISRVFGLILLVCFVVYITVIVLDAIKERARHIESDEDNGKPILIRKCIVFIIAGVIAIKFGGDMVVNSASKIAIMAGISETLVGLTIVSVGTSLPELVTSIVAAKKGELQMAIGNAIGSNIFNILLILGVAAMANPIAIIRENIIDTIVLVVCSAICYVFCVTGKTLKKKEGIIMLALYVIYLAYIINR